MFSMPASDAGDAQTKEEVSLLIEFEKEHASSIYEKVSALNALTNKNYDARSILTAASQQASNEAIIKAFKFSNSATTRWVVNKMRNLMTLLALYVGDERLDEFLSSFAKSFVRTKDTLVIIKRKIKYNDKIDLAGLEPGTVRALITLKRELIVFLLEVSLSFRDQEMSLYSPPETAVQPYNTEGYSVFSFSDSSQLIKVFNGSFFYAGGADISDVVTTVFKIQYSVFGELFEILNINFEQSTIVDDIMNEEFVGFIVSSLLLNEYANIGALDMYNIIYSQMQSILANNDDIHTHSILFLMDMGVFTPSILKLDDKYNINRVILELNASIEKKYGVSMDAASNEGVQLVNAFYTTLIKTKFKTLCGSNEHDIDWEYRDLDEFKKYAHENSARVTLAFFNISEFFVESIRDALEELDHPELREEGDILHVIVQKEMSAELIALARLRVINAILLKLLGSLDQNEQYTQDEIVSLIKENIGVIKSGLSFVKI